MEWLWLLLALIGLGLIWLAMWGIDQLVKRVKTRDDTRRADAVRLEQKIAREETDFLRVRAAKDFLEKPQTNPDADSNEVPQEFRDAMTLLSGDEFLDSMVKGVFGAERDASSVMATRSAFDTTPVKTAVAKGNGVSPVKAGPADKRALSKAEQKIYKKIKQKG